MARSERDNDRESDDGDRDLDTSEGADAPKKVKGEVKEVLGAITGDRRVEAEGRLDQRVADPDAPETRESDAAVSNQEHAVRQAHHDVGAEAPPSDGPLGT